MSIPRAHHYLPQFYLRGFSREDRLWVYDRYKNEYRNQTPKNIAVERDYYTVTDENGGKKTDIEKFKTYFYGLVVVITKFFFYLNLLVILWNLDFRFDFTQLLMPAMVILLYVVGIMIGKAKRNYFIGIRTP